MRERELGRGRRGVREQRAMQAEQAILPVERRLPVVAHGGVVEGGAQVRGDVGGHRDAAVPAVGHVAQRGQVVARQQHPVVAAQLALHGGAGHVGGRVLDADDVGQLGQPAQGVVADVHRRASGHVVDQHRQLNRLVDRRIVGVEALLARTIVVGRHHQGGVRADGLGVLDQLDRLFGGVRPRAGDDRHAAGGGLHGQLDHAAVLVMRKGRGLACRAHGHDAVDSARDLTLDESDERLLVHHAVAEGSHQGRHHALEQGI